MEEQDITREFLDAMIGVRKASKIPHFFSELSYSELAVFRAMRFLSGGCLPKELVKTSDISAHIQISKPALSQVINKLEDKGLVERVVQKSDRRSVYVRFTRKGIGMFERQNAQMHEAINMVVEKMGYEDTLRFITLMKKFHEVVAHVDMEEIQRRLSKAQSGKTGAPTHEGKETKEI